MKLFVVASLLLVAASASLLDEHVERFQAFKLKHDKVYMNQVEETRRFNIFRDNLRSIEEHNALYEKGLVSYKQGVTAFADMTHEEFKAMLALSSANKPQVKTTEYVPTGVTANSSVDWREKGAVTEVKYQGQCGSCWAFALVGSTEAAYFFKSGNLVPLSTQQLVDCTQDINNGCYGGSVAGTYPYIQANGIVSEESYPYTGLDETCDSSALNDIVTKIDGYVVVETRNEQVLREAVYSIGPISAGMDASYLAYYESGIYEDDWCGELMNHGVLIVGYGTENGKDYWLVKNTWGATWGENGYFRIARGTNECDIASAPSYPIIN